MATCKDCISNDMCKDMVNFGIVDLPYEDETPCKHFINKASILDIPDNSIMYVQDKWLVLNTESEYLGEAIKRVIEYSKGGT